MFLESGEVELFAGEDQESLKKIPFITGDSFHIPPGTIYRLRALKDARVFEVSTPELDDVVRLKDEYGRNP